MARGTATRRAMTRSGYRLTAGGNFRPVAALATRRTGAPRGHGEDEKGRTTVKISIQQRCLEER